MGRKIQGHGSCLVCHPDLNRKYAKNDTKGLRRIKASIRRQLQDSLDDLVTDIANDVTQADDVAA